MMSQARNNVGVVWHILVLGHRQLLLTCFNVVSVDIFVVCSDCEVLTIARVISGFDWIILNLMCINYTERAFILAHWEKVLNQTVRADCCH